MVSLLFYLKRAKSDSIGRAMIYARITIEGRRSEFSTGRKIHPSQWNPETFTVLGFSPEVRQLNTYLIKNES